MDAPVFRYIMAEYPGDLQMRGMRLGFPSKDDLGHPRLRLISPIHLYSIVFDCTFLLYVIYYLYNIILNATHALQ